MGGKSALDDRGVHAKLQMFFDGDAAVNAARAEHSGVVAVVPDQAQRTVRRWAESDPRQQDVQAAPPWVQEALPPVLEVVDPPAPTEHEVYYSFFGELLQGRDEQADAWIARAGHEVAEAALPPLRVTHARDRLRTFEATTPQVEALWKEGHLSNLEPALDLHRPGALIGATHTVRPPPASRSGLPPEPTPAEVEVEEGTGGKVLIGIIDVGGFDFAHPDFLVPGKNDETRFVAIWDQGGRLRGHPRDPRTPGAGSMFAYGSEIEQAHMNAALRKQAEVGVPAWLLEPQSVMQPASHGTHVASIAAGRDTPCKDALLAAVLVDVPELADPRLSFYDTSRIVHAVEYLVALGESLGVPVAINVSLATNGHAHDASGAGSRWLDAP